MSPNAESLFGLRTQEKPPMIEVSGQKIPYVLVDYPVGLITLPNTFGYARSSMGILFQLEVKDRLLHYLGAYNFVDFRDKRLVARVGVDGIVTDGSYQKSRFSFVEPRGAEHFKAMFEMVIKDGCIGLLYEQTGYDLTKRLG